MFFSLQLDIESCCASYNVCGYCYCVSRNVSGRVLESAARCLAKPALFSSPNQRLPWSLWDGKVPLSVVRSSSSTLPNLLLWNYLATCYQIGYVVSCTKNFHMVWVIWPTLPHARIRKKNTLNLLNEKMNYDLEVSSIGYTSTTKITQIVTLGWPWPFLPRLFKLWHWVDLDLFYAKIKFGCMGFYIIRHRKTIEFSETEDSMLHSVKWEN